MSNQETSSAFEYDANAFVYGSYLCVVGVLILLSIMIPPLDAVILINGWNSRFLDIFFSVVTEFGNGLIMVPFAVLLLFRRVSLTLALATCAALQGIIVGLMKRVFFPTAMRPINFLDASGLHFVSGIEVHKMMSFPSGHTVTIFALCTFLSLCYRNNILTSLLVLMAVSVGISRIYLLQHFLTDIAFGSLIGVVTGGISYLVFEKSRRPLWMENRFEIRFNLAQTKSNSIGQ